MVVTNIRHETAIVIRRDGQTAVFVKLNTRKLVCDRLTETQFREQWQEAPSPLVETLQRFLEHAKIHGATPEVRKGLQKLLARDVFVVASLF